MRGRDKIKPFYDLVANIATEELGHIELVSATINSMLNGATESAPPTDAPLSSILGARNLHQFLTNGNSTVVANSMNMPWQGNYVFSSGDLILDLLHNFFLENGARLQRIRVYEMTQNSVARQMIGYLLVRGGVHAAAYAKALEDLTGVTMTKMLPIPKIENSTFPEARQFEERGVHRKLYRFSQNDYKDIGAIWRGPFPTGGEYEVVDGPPEGGPLADLPPEPENYAPGYHPDELAEIAQRLMRAM